MTDAHPRRTSPVPLDRQGLLDRLRAYASDIDHDPMTNSVFSLAMALFQDLDSGHHTLEALTEPVDTFHFDLLCERAEDFRKQHSLNGDGPWASVRTRLEAAAAEGKDAFLAATQKAHGGIVFTAHPTFALSRSLRQAFAHHVTANDEESLDSLKAEASRPNTDWPGQITLLSEHEEAQNAIACAQQAARAYGRLILEVAQDSFSNSWRSLRPVLPTIASWVGYDLDGRTDIHWSQSIALRLREKEAQLGYYIKRLDGLEASEQTGALADRLGKARDHTARAAELFEGDLFDPDTLVRAANFLTADSDDKLIDTDAIIAPLTALIDDPATEAGLAADLIVLRAEIEALQLGTARIHLRVNAAQVRTVLSRDLELETEDVDLGRLALSQLSEMAASDEVRPVNFADLFIEQSTARRQFMMCAQILKHIDARSPIRFLIAESENPATVMGALYLARQYGVAHALDISPLFETPEALETGGRFVERLLEEPAFLDYVKTRGYLSIQLGFSDSGRFIGQVAGNMAIERIHNLIGRAVGEKLPGIGLLFFNTHGESMGRGAYPGTFEQRFDHLLTRWARAGLIARDIHPMHEVSFQGGDGFLHFGTPALSEATYAAFCEHVLSNTDGSAGDPFYEHTDFVWDAYRALRHWQETLFVDSDYARMLSGFATGFLVKAGSRPVKRAGSVSGPSAIRAISHNAMLQQLGVPLNSACGIGSSVERETERLRDLINDSPRMHALVMLATRARMLTSLPALRGYASVYDPEVWLAVAKHGTVHNEAALRRVADSISDYTTSTSLKRIANILAVDLIKFDRLLATLDDAPSVESRHEGRLEIHALHAIRQAVMMYALSLIGRLRNFSARHDTSLEDIIDLVLSLRIQDAVEMLETIYPASRDETELIEGVSERGFEAAETSAAGYDQLHREIIDPLRLTDELIRRISVATCQAFGAWG
ncbi:phosphoenolpyruvate carboxylase [Henriciella aquimarina]|uniref:phosphoenolpyruvate carboxylase n=1 Tax=Henriciella aquimarina TaxID=545261 RepID=UPI000A02D77D|nr:phosphoenolpyruvate carboxylase [Henriciella aquimarina]